MPVYVDASALTPLIIVEDYTPWALATILDSGESPLVSDFAAAEVASAISRLVRMRSLAREEGVRLLAGFDDWVRKDALAVITASTDIVEADRLVRRFELQLQTPDARYTSFWRADVRLRWSRSTGGWRALLRRSAYPS